MPTPSDGYRDAAGNRVPSVTTVIHDTLGWGSEQLMGWAQWLGGQGRDWVQVRDEAGAVGSVAHERIQAELGGKEFDSTFVSVQVVKASLPCFRAFVRWRAQFRAVCVLLEEQSLTSTIHGFGGTVDDVLQLDGWAVLVDWKSSTAIRASHVVQVAAYWHLLKEARPDVWSQLKKEALIVNVTKKGQLVTKLVTEAEVDAGWKAFRCLLAIYNLKPILSPQEVAQP